MKLIKQQTGAVLIEFVLCLPIMVYLCFGMYELYWFYHTHIETYDIATKIGMWSSVDTSNVTKYIQEGYNLGTDINLQGQGSILVTGLITGNANGHGVNQTQWVKGSGSTGVTATSPALSSASSFTLNYQTVVVEVAYTYQPIFNLGFISSQTFKKTFCIDYRGNPSLFLAS